MKIKRNYNWKTIIRDKEIIEFEKNNGIENQKLNLNRYYVLSYLINLYSNKKYIGRIKTKWFHGEKYIYVSTTFLMNNLRLLKSDKRTITRILEDLEKFNFINRIIDEHVYRYIKINIDLLDPTKNSLGYEAGYQELISTAKYISPYFGKTEDHQLIEVIEFLKTLDDLNYFTERFEEFVEYKDYSLEKWPRFESFIQTWDKQNWNSLLERLKQQEELKRFDS